MFPFYLYLGQRETQYQLHLHTSVSFLRGNLQTDQSIAGVPERGRYRKTVLSEDQKGEMLLREQPGKSAGGLLQ